MTTATANEPPAIDGAPQHAEYPYAVFAVGDKANVRRYTDIEPATVVRVSPNGRTVDVQIDKYKLADGESPNIIPGGFAGHCTNQRSMKYDITRNQSGTVERYTLRKWRGRYCWTIKGANPDGHQMLAAGWVAFYDYNF